MRQVGWRSGDGGMCEDGIVDLFLGLRSFYAGIDGIML